MVDPADVTADPSSTVRRDDGSRATPLPALATRGLAVTTAAIAALLIAFSGRYGYHRDELYFIQCGRHLAWGYPDQPPLTPFLARLMTDLSSTSLVVFRLPSTLAIAATVYLTGLIARELGGDRRDQVFAAACLAVTNVVLATGHLLSTTTFDLPAWAAISWLAIRAVRRSEDHLWLVIGLVAGVGLLDSDLVIFLIGSLFVGVLVCGPREILRSPWLWAGAVVMFALWAPYLIWQGQHGWPEFAIARSIAAGNSGTSAPRAALLPGQILLSGFFVAPVWIVGLWRFARAAVLKPYRGVAVAWVVLVVVYTISGGKPYYLSGMLPLLLAAGAPATLAWARRGRRDAIPTLIVVLSLVGIVITLPVLPIDTLHNSPVVAANYDAGETVDWPTYVHQIAAAYDQVPAGQRASTIVLGSNYGEAGAVDRYGRAVGLPSAYGVQNAFWLWGPPPASATTVVAVGFDRGDLTPYFASVRLAVTLDNHHDVDNDEQGEHVWICTGQTSPWPALWQRLKDYG